MPWPRSVSVSSGARGKYLFSPPDLGERQGKLLTDGAAAAEFLESACPKTRVPAVWHSRQTNRDGPGARMAGQGRRCARRRGLPTVGSTDLVRKAGAGHLYGVFPAAAAQRGADEQAARAEHRSSHLTQHRPSRSSQQGTRTTPGCTNLSPTGSRRCFGKDLSPRLTPAARRFSRSDRGFGFLQGAGSLSPHTGDPKIKG